MLSAKAAHAPPRNMVYRQANPAPHQAYTSSYESPTESEFSVTYDDGDVRNWDEHRVVQWLQSIGAGHYADIFFANNMTGENLMDIDQTILKEMGVKKVGDRVRIASAAKNFRHQEYRLKTNRNRDSMAQLDNRVPTPPLSASPRSGNRQPRAPSTSRNGHHTDHNRSRPNSPFYRGPEPPNTLPLRRDAISPRDNSQHEQDGYFNRSTNNYQKALETPQTARFLGGFGRPQEQHTRYGNQSKARTLSVDVAAANNGYTSLDKFLVRVIYDTGTMSVLSVEGCKTAEDIVLRSLKKGKLNEGHLKSYCFHLLDGTEPFPQYTRRISEAELLRICTDGGRKERERLMFRKIHAGEPEGAQLQLAADIALGQMKAAQSQALSTNLSRSQKKIQALTGENLPTTTFPHSPIQSVAERQRNLDETSKTLEKGSENDIMAGLPTPRPRPRKNKPHLNPGERPPSEFIVNDVDNFFPEAKEKVERAIRMSYHRSQRLSRASSRLSVASNLSFTSTDAPPVPAIPSWYGDQSGLHTARPLSIFANGMGSFRNSEYRQSIASTSLEPLDEESPLEPNRQSYVSFAGDSNSGSPESSAHVQVTDPDGKPVPPGGSFFDGGSSPIGSTSNNSLPITEAGGTLNKELSAAIAEDGEEKDEELNKFLSSDPTEEIQYIRGKLIGSGSFGNVYLALHTVTAQIMAVKQVELPSLEDGDNKKKGNMVTALKSEIALLRELKHPHIVQYLGSSSEANNLNIFLEYIDGGSIAKMLVDYGSLNENIVQIYVRQILVGLAYLHSKDIIHRDIKGANILVDSHGAVKISDFGISKRVQDSKTAALLSEGDPGAADEAKAAGKKKGKNALNRVSLQGSVFWMAPEVVKQTAYTRKADIWSLGCLVVEMLTGSHPHPTLSQLQAIFKIGGSGGNTDPAPEIPGNCSERAKDFLRQTFKLNHEERPEAEELLRSSFLRGG